MADRRRETPGGVTHHRFASSVVLALALSAALAAPAGARPCELASSDREWIVQAIAIWSRAAEALERRIDVMPRTVLYDEHCVVHLDPRRGRATTGEGERHGAGGQLAVSFDGKPVPVRSIAYRKRFKLPSGAEQGSAAVAFTSLAKDGDTFFVMALPSVWRKDPRSMPGENIEEFASGVLAHEMTHTIHLASVLAALLDVRRRQSTMPERIDDDCLQVKVFGDDAGYVAAYDREMALYRSALAERDDQAARVLVRQALAASDQRRARYFEGENAYFSDVEPLFLNMEGVASWVAYTVVGHGADPIEFAGRFWSQQEGLILFLLLDRFDPKWKKRVFDRVVPSPFEMLREAVGAGASVGGQAAGD